jgi:hypothetical protein
MLCHEYAVLKATFQVHGRFAAGERDGMCGLASAVQRRHLDDLPFFGFFFSGYHAEFHEGCYQKHTNLLNCRTSSSDISGNHADFHEGHGTV